MGHHLTPAAEGRRGQPTAHDLAEGEQIRRPSLDGAFRPPPAGRPDPKTGHHLIQDEQCPVGVTKPTHSGVETRQRRDNSHVGGGGFGDDSGDLVRIPDERRLDGAQVVVGHDDRFCCGSGSHARCFRQAEGRHSRTSRGEQGVDMTMVAAGKLYDLRTSGETPREPQRAHGGLGPGVDQPDLLDRGHSRHDLFGQLDLTRARRAVARTTCRRRPQRLDDRRVGMTKNHRPPRADQVDIPATVRVSEVCAIPGHHEARCAANSLKRPDR